MLPASLERFIHVRKIDSCYKICFLLFLHRPSSGDQINRGYVHEATLTDGLTPDEKKDELQDAGLLYSSGEALMLSGGPEVSTE